MQTTDGARGNPTLACRKMFGGYAEPVRTRPNLYHCRHSQWLAANSASTLMLLRCKSHPLTPSPSSATLYRIRHSASKPFGARFTWCRLPTQQAQQPRKRTILKTIQTVNHTTYLKSLPPRRPDHQSLPHMDASKHCIIASLPNNFRVTRCQPEEPSPFLYDKEPL
jgi:hypothetical protein